MKITIAAESEEIIMPLIIEAFKAYFECDKNRQETIRLAVQRMGLDGQSNESNELDMDIIKRFISYVVIREGV